MKSSEKISVAIGAQRWLTAINDFRSRHIDLRDFLDRTLVLLDELRGSSAQYFSELEDAWGEVEVVFALALSEQQQTLNEDQSDHVEHSIDRMATTLARSL